MDIFELTYPGTWITLPDNDLAFKVMGLLYSLKEHYTDISVALNLFDQVYGQRPVIPDESTWEDDERRRQEIEEELLRQDPALGEWDNLAERYFRIEVELKRRKWREGAVPDAYQHRLPFIYARSFLNSLDQFSRFLDDLSELDQLPGGVSAAQDKFRADFPTLREVRNSDAHANERMRLKGRGKKVIVPQPINNTMISAPGGGVILMGSLNGRRYGNMMIDGHYGEVEVSVDSVLLVQECLQSIIDAFEWTGPKDHYPR